MEKQQAPFFKYRYPQRFVKLVIGLLLFGLSSALNYRSMLGLSPWNVFHAGISLMTGVTIGRITQLVGAAIILIDIALREPIGIGTIANMFIIGGSMDMFLNSGLLPQTDSLPVRWFMLLAGIAVCGLGSYLYMSAAMGAGPRDSMRVGLIKRFPNVPIGILRNAIEMTALGIGWFMGGLVGIGTVASALLLGPSIQYSFKLFRFDVKSIHSENIAETFAIWTGKKTPDSAQKDEVPAPEIV
ncbi:hypothetical protein SDC9_80859 [bioreactor metagenome]|uniref:Uncharacterized protein n=1 Tax=bioreactor metagenome TaxID=1076179 RepID=A0A644Z0X5_9ZZZZ